MESPAMSRAPSVQPETGLKRSATGAWTERPLEWTKPFVRWFVRRLYRVNVNGLEHHHQAGSRVVVVANHVSFLDAALLTLFLPGRLTFAIDPHSARSWWVRPFLAFVEVIP